MINISYNEVTRTFYDLPKKDVDIHSLRWNVNKLYIVKSKLIFASYNEFDIKVVFNMMLMFDCYSILSLRLLHYILYEKYTLILEIKK